MKKVYLIFACAFLLLLIGCINSVEKTTLESSAEVTGPNYIKEMKETYAKLNLLYDKIDVLASDLYAAWHYGIFEDNQTKSGLARRVSLTSEELTGSLCSLLFMDDFQYTVGCLRQSHKELQSYKKIRDELNILRNDIREYNTSQNENDIKLATKLQEYHIALSGLLDLSENYSGSFKSLQDDIQKYRNKINDIRLILDFDLG